MNIKYIAFVGAIAAVLVGTIIIAIDSGFANENNQITSHIHDCGNEFESVNVVCQITTSQMQDGQHSVSITSEQTFEEEEEKEENKPAPANQQSISPSIVLPH